MRNLEGLSAFPLMEYLGMGFNIYKEYDIITSRTVPLVNLYDSAQKTVNFLDQKFWLPSFISLVADTKEDERNEVFESRESFQNSIAINTNVEAGYGAFSGQLSASYGKEFHNNNEYNFSYYFDLSQLGSIQLDYTEAKEYLTEFFRKQVEKLPDYVDDNNFYEFIDFFDDFGIYFISKLIIGGSLEYYSAINKQSNLSTEQIKANVKIDYKSLFSSGGVEVGFENKETWERYQANKQSTLTVRGGDTTLLADPSESTTASQTSTAIFQQWKHSLIENPGTIDFKLTGIWQLCGDKKDVVKKAFMEYGQTLMRPELTIDAYKSELPIIKIGSVIEPEGTPEYPQGYRLVILDRTNLKIKPLIDKYYSFPSENWWIEYTKMYEDMFRDLRPYLEITNQSRYFILLTSFGIDANQPPTYDLYQVLLSSGAGSKLMTWRETSDPGSSLWTPIIYVLVGIIGNGVKMGREMYIWESTETKAAMSVIFYREGLKYGRYSIG